MQLRNMRIKYGSQHEQEVDDVDRIGFFDIKSSPSRCFCVVAQIFYGGARNAGPETQLNGHSDD